MGKWGWAKPLGGNHDGSSESLRSSSHAAGQPASQEPGLQTNLVGWLGWLAAWSSYSFGLLCVWFMRPSASAIVEVAESGDKAVVEALMAQFANETNPYPRFQIAVALSKVALGWQRAGTGRIWTPAAPHARGQEACPVGLERAARRSGWRVWVWSATWTSHPASPPSQDSHPARQPDESGRLAW